jgi:hypothetical protein
VEIDRRSGGRVAQTFPAFRDGIPRMLPQSGVRAVAMAQRPARMTESTRNGWYRMKQAQLGSRCRALMVLRFER